MNESNNILNFQKRSKRQKGKSAHQELVELISRADTLIRERRFVPAKKILDKLVSEGAYQAYYDLGFIHSFDAEPNLIQDYELAREYYLRAITEAHSAEACIALARMKRMGKGGEVDYEGSRQLLEELVEQGVHFRGFVFWLIGRYYALGEGVDVDLEMASSYFKKGAEYGHLPSLGWLGAVKQRQGRFLKGLGLRIKAGLIVLMLLVVDRKSDRLKMN